VQSKRAAAKLFPANAVFRAVLCCIFCENGSYRVFDSGCIMLYLIGLEVVGGYFFFLSF
jgi:hypothetical protein